VERVHDTPGGEIKRETERKREKTEKRWKRRRGVGWTKTISQAL